MIAATDHIHAAHGLQRYVVHVVAATRSLADARLGASPRGSIALLRAAKVRAAAEGRDFATPEDVKTLAVPVLAHRVLLSAEAQGAGLHPGGRRPGERRDGDDTCGRGRPRGGRRPAGDRLRPGVPRAARAGGGGSRRPRVRRARCERTSAGGAAAGDPPSAGDPGGAVRGAADGCATARPHGACESTPTSRAWAVASTPSWRWPCPPFRAGARATPPTSCRPGRGLCWTSARCVEREPIPSDCGTAGSSSAASSASTSTPACTCWTRSAGPDRASDPPGQWSIATQAGLPPSRRRGRRRCEGAPRSGWRPGTPPRTGAGPGCPARPRTAPSAPRCGRAGRGGRGRRWPRSLDRRARVR